MSRFRMSKRLLASFLCAAGVACGLAWAMLPVPSLGLTVDRKLHEFDSTDRRLQTTFQLRNESGSQIKIVDVKASCGCTAASVGTTTLNPGGTTELMVRMTQPALGERESTVTIESDFKGQEPIVLRLVAKSASDQPRVVIISPFSIRLTRDKCPERQMHVVTFETLGKTDEGLKASCTIDGVILEMDSETALPFGDDKFARFERTYRVRLNSSDTGAMKSGKIILSFGDPATHLPSSRSIPIEIFQ